MTNTLRTATEPFQFFTLACATRTAAQKANTVRELLHSLETCSDGSIYHHMVHSLNGNSMNDFAKWLHGAANCGGLPEQLAALDERYYTTIEEMRKDLRTTVSGYLIAYPECGDAPASSPFFFCEGLELSVPLDLTARTLEEFKANIRVLSDESFYLHFVAANSRTERRSNDFSIWLASGLGMDELARKLNEIDLTDMTLAAVRESVLELIDASPDVRE